MGSRRDTYLLALYLFLTTSSLGFIQPFLPLYLQSAGFDKRMIGVALGVGSGLGFAIQPLIGRLTDRLDARRPFISVMALTAAAAYLAIPYAGSFAGYLMLIAVGTNGTMYLQTVGGVLVGRLVQAGQGGAAYANLRLWGSVGYIVAAVCVGLGLGQRISDREVLTQIFRFGPLVFVPIALLAWALPDVRKQDARAPEFGAALRDSLAPDLRRFLLAYFFYCMALYGASSFLSLFMRSLGASGPWVSATFVGGVIVEVFVMRWAGKFSDRYGRRPALAFSFLLLPIRLLLYVPATSPAWIFAVQLLHGLNFGIVGAVAIAFANDLSDNRTRGYAQSRLSASQGLAMAIGPLLFGEAAQRLGLAAMFVSAAFVALLGALTMVFGVHDSHPESRSIAERFPSKLQPALRWLDTPPRRKPRD